MIHLATHGYFCEELPAAIADRDAAIGDAAGGDSAGRDAEDRRRPRVHFSCPVSFCPGSSGDDGVLTAQEIVSLDLHRARWVVLSACGSGLAP